MYKYIYLAAKNIRMAKNPLRTKSAHAFVYFALVTGATRWGLNFKFICSIRTKQRMNSVSGAPVRGVPITYVADR